VIPPAPNTSGSDVGGGWCGVDTIRLAVPLGTGAAELSHRRIKEIANEQTGEIITYTTGWYQQLPAGLWLNVRPTPNGRMASLECSAPKLLRGHNVVPVTVSELILAVTPVWDEAAEMLGIAMPLLDARVSRLDIARDFAADSTITPTVLDGLSKVKIARNPPVKLYRAQEHEGVQTLSVSTGDRWQATLYGKEEEVERQVHQDPDRWASPALQQARSMAANRLRFEARFRAGMLPANGVRTVADLDDDLISEISRRLWDHCGFGRSFGVPALHDSCAKAHATSPAEARTLARALGWLMADMVGSPLSVSHNTADSYRAGLRRNGVDEALVRGAFGDGVPYRLDYDSGRLVAT